MTLHDLGKGWTMIIHPDGTCTFSNPAGVALALNAESMAILRKILAS